MEKLIQNRNGDEKNVPDLKGAIVNVAQQFDDYYSDVCKEKILDYPMAIVSALVRIALDQGVPSGSYDKKMKVT